MIKIKQKYKKSIHELWYVPSTHDLFIIMEILATIEFLSSVRSSFQLLAIKKKNKDNDREGQENEIKFRSKWFYGNTKTNV